MESKNCFSNGGMQHLLEVKGAWKHMTGRPTKLMGWQMNYFEPSADDPDLMMGRQPYNKDSGWSTTYIPWVLYYLWSFKKRKDSEDIGYAFCSEEEFT